MREKFDHKEIEGRWREKWYTDNIYAADDLSIKPKKYILCEFPYPSGTRLHMGHVMRYTIPEIYSRKLRMSGYNVLFPMGWDAFGLPAENYAVKTGVHPAETTKKAIDTFRTLFKQVGYGVDWAREINTTDPSYYKWTQWIFLKFYEAGLAQLKEEPVWWSEELKTILANEEVIKDQNGDMVAERDGKSKVERRLLKQWVLKIPEYAEQLIDGLADIQFPESIKSAQINWIGKSEGLELNFKIKDLEEIIKVFTTRVDTVYGVSFLVIAPEHPIVDRLITSDQEAEVQTYIEHSKQKTELQRMSEEKSKSGVFTGSYAINPYRGKEVPIYLADYVLMNYGTGAVMGVPAHDERDYIFAKKYNLPILNVINKSFGEFKDDSLQRDVTYAVFFNPVSQKYGYNLWQKFQNAPALVGGGINENEEVVDALKREIREETGFDDCIVIESLGEVYGNYYSEKRKTWVNSHVRGYFVILNSDKNIGDQKESYEEFDFKWGSAKEIFNLISNCSLNTTNSECVEELMKRGIRFAVEKGYDKENKDLAAQFKEIVIEDYGILVNSLEHSGLASKDAIIQFSKFAEDHSFGARKIHYKLRDWLFSRQRYWGEPIPLIHKEDGFVEAIVNTLDSEQVKSKLPLILPDVPDYTPLSDASSPLAKNKEWVNTFASDGSVAKRETNTMPNWAGSCWYYLRYLDPKNDDEFASMEKMKYWLPVDKYFGGSEHTTLHLLYSRFWHKFLFDKNLVPTPEPYAWRMNGGILLGPDGQKMSKSRGNVINPDDIIEKYGVDALRMFVCFMGPYDGTIVWNENGVNACKNLINTIFALRDKVNEQKEDELQLRTAFHKLVKNVTNMIDELKMNTAISEIMIFVSEAKKANSISSNMWKEFIKIIAPFAVFSSEELWQEFNNFNVWKKENSVHLQEWPKYIEEYTIDKTITLGIQVNGKIRGEVSISLEDSEEVVKQKVLSTESVKKWIAGKEIKKFIYVKGKIISLVV